jgi:pilus assembly protein CpaE
MESGAALKHETAPVTVCTISRDMQNFNLLIGDLDRTIGDSWGDLQLDEAVDFLLHSKPGGLEFVALALDALDEPNGALIDKMIALAKHRNIQVLVIADNVSPSFLHQLLRTGADDFVPYPLPEGAFEDAVARLRQGPAPRDIRTKPDERSQTATPATRDAAILPVHGLSGGAGATNFAVNLAWELTLPDRVSGWRKKDPLIVPPRVCLIDLDFQFGSTSTYLDLTRRDTVFELLSDTAAMDSESFMNSLQVYNERLHVLTAPADILPLDFLTPEDVSALIEVARVNFDFVVIDMPTALVAWTETVLSKAHIYFPMMLMDMRSAQNALHFLRLLKGEDLPVEKLRFVLNKAPKFTDIGGKARVKRLAESLGIDIELRLPHGHAQVKQACDNGNPIALSAPKNPLRREICKLAVSLHELIQSEQARS